LAEFSRSVESVQYLIDCGANPDVRGQRGVHVVVNAMMPEVQELLSRLTGVPIPVKPTPIPTVKMSKEAWKEAKAIIDQVFKSLKSKGLIARQNAGYTQSDGFSDCSEEYHAHPARSTVLGFCFYTRQDLNRAKSSSVLPLAFWGAPDGQEEQMVAVGKLIVDTFTEAKIDVQWSGDGSSRPSLLLHRFSEPRQS
jgi:bifunctional non-homologous end joining protein LigD